MNYDWDVLKKCPLFSDIDEKDIVSLLTYLHAKERKFQKDELLFAAGDHPECVGIVISGSVYIVQEDYWGNRTILSCVRTGEIFGEAFSCAQVSAFPVSVLAHENGTVMLINCNRIFNTDSFSNVFHARLILNLIKVLAEKNIALTSKMKHITKKTIQNKVLSYLSECAILSGKDVFEIPFNRQEMADYLSVDRSALSGTLCKMREEGIIEFRKNKFKIKKL